MTLGVRLYGDVTTFALAWADLMLDENRRQVRCGPANAINSFRLAYLGIWKRVHKLAHEEGQFSLKLCKLFDNFQFLPLCVEFDRAQALVKMAFRDRLELVDGMHWYTKSHTQAPVIDDALKAASSRDITAVTRKPVEPPWTRCTCGIRMVGKHWLITLPLNGPCGQLF